MFFQFIVIVILYYTHCHYSSLYSVISVNSFIANVICYITIPSLNKVLYLVSCILYLVSCILYLVSCMFPSLLHLVDLRPRVYYTITNLGGGERLGKGPLGPSQYSNELFSPTVLKIYPKLSICGIKSSSYCKSMTS